MALPPRTGSIFDRMDRMTSRTVDSINAAAFSVVPVTANPNGRPAPDPDRGEIIGKGIFSQVPSRSDVEIGERDRTGNDLRALVNGFRYVFSVDVARYPDARNVRQGDRLAIDHARVFTITSVKPDGLSRVDWVLSHFA